KPIAPETFDKSQTDVGWAYEVKKQVYELVE
ncbi:MAG TPA: glycerol acyltransferase, partial [Cryomorphaceae bacterium]|nr:glycerol acyltransferase [Cryomorphaceae bacterium]